MDRASPGAPKADGSGDTVCLLEMLRQICVHDIPLLRVANEDVYGGLEPAWFVQTGGRQADDIAFRVFPDGQTGTAFDAEATQVVAPIPSCRGIMLQRACGNLEGF